MLENIKAITIIEAVTKLTEEVIKHKENITKVKSIVNAHTRMLKRHKFYLNEH